MGKVERILADGDGAFIADGDGVPITEEGSSSEEIQPKPTGLEHDRQADTLTWEGQQGWIEWRILTANKERGVRSEVAQLGQTQFSTAPIQDEDARSIRVVPFDAYTQRAGVPSRAIFIRGSKMKNILI